MVNITLQVHLLPHHRPGAQWEYLVMISHFCFPIKIKIIWHVYCTCLSLCTSALLNWGKSQQRAPQDNHDRKCSTAFTIVVIDASAGLSPWKLLCFRSASWPLKFCYGEKHIALQKQGMFVFVRGQYVSLVDDSLHSNQKISGQKGQDSVFIIAGLCSTNSYKYKL